jgi:glycosyltransferase involved in cell wall biosynthesis
LCSAGTTQRGGSPIQFHVLSFEGPDPYARAGGLATRVEGLSETLGQLGFETHLWFIGDPAEPGNERRNGVNLHRWAQWISRHHPGGVYEGELGKQAEFTRTLPPHLLREWLLPHLGCGGRAVVLAEEWHTAAAAIHLHALLERAGVRDRVAILWNANNTFGFERIDWRELARAAHLTTVSRYMRHQMGSLGVDPAVIPNGLPGDAFLPPDRAACRELRRRFHDRTLVVKMARFDPDKRWVAAVESVALMKRRGWRPLLVARGGAEPHGAEVEAAMRAHGLLRVDRESGQRGAGGLLEALRDVRAADVVSLRSHVDPAARSVLFRGAAAVLANSGREPFGLVGLETMAAGGLACTGCTGEDYAVAGQNALVLQTADPEEFVGLYQRLRTRPDEARALRRQGRSTARRFAWEAIVQRVLLPWVELSLPAHRRMLRTGAETLRRAAQAPTVRGTLAGGGGLLPAAAPHAGRT